MFRRTNGSMTKGNKHSNHSRSEIDPQPFKITVEIDVGYGNALYIAAGCPTHFEKGSMYLPWQTAARMECVGENKWEIYAGFLTNPKTEIKFLVGPHRNDNHVPTSELYYQHGDNLRLVRHDFKLTQDDFADYYKDLNRCAPGK